MGRKEPGSVVCRLRANQQPPAGGRAATKALPVDAAATDGQQQQADVFLALGLLSSQPDAKNQYDARYNTLLSRPPATLTARSDWLSRRANRCPCPKERVQDGFLRTRFTGQKLSVGFVESPWLGIDVPGCGFHD